MAGKAATVGASGSGVRTVQLSRYAGDWLAWRPDSRSLTWSLGPAFYHQTLDAAFDTAAVADADESAGWVQANARISATVTEIQLSVPKPLPRGTVVLRDAVVGHDHVGVLDDLVAPHGDDACPAQHDRAGVLMVVGRRGRLRGNRL